MAFWNRWLQRKGASDSLALFRELMGGAAAKSGVTINAQTALECGVALACARVISEGLMQVPFRLMRSNGDTRLPATDDPLYDLMAVSPNEWQTSAELLEQIGLHLVFSGNAYVWKNMVGGRVRELLAFEPGDVSVKRDGYELEYRVADRVVPTAEMWHLRGPSWSGWQGLDGVKLAREAIGLAVVGEEHGAYTFSNGARVQGFLKAQGSLDDVQRARLRQAWQDTYGGTRNSGKVAILSANLDWVNMQASNVDAQFIESRRFQIEEVCRAFRVMPIMVGSTDKAATYASAEQMFLAHVTHTLGPWYKRVEASANKGLLTQRQRAQGLYFKFFANALLRGATKDRSEFYSKMYGIGALNPNEIRELEDMNPYPAGSAYRVPLNMADPAAPVLGEVDEQD